MDDWPYHTTPDSVHIRQYHSVWYHTTMLFVPRLENRVDRECRNNQMVCNVPNPPPSIIALTIRTTA